MPGYLREGGVDTAISQATTVPLGGGLPPPDSQENETAEIDVDQEGDDDEGLEEIEATAGELSTSPPSPLGGISDALEELRPVMEPPVPTDPSRIPARKADSMEEFIPGPTNAEPLGHHTSALERLLVKRGDKESSGSESSRKPPPPLKSPGWNHLALARIFDLWNAALLRQNTSTLTHLAKQKAQTGRTSCEAPRPCHFLKFPPGPEETVPPPMRTTRLHGGAFEGRLLAHLEPLKADVSDINICHTELHREIVQFTSEVRRQGERLDAVPNTFRRPPLAQCPQQHTIS